VCLLILLSLYKCALRFHHPLFMCPLLKKEKIITCRGEGMIYFVCWAGRKQLPTTFRRKENTRVQKGLRP
jgi:hypothetical protein